MKVTCRLSPLAQEPPMVQVLQASASAPAFDPTRWATPSSVTTPRKTKGQKYWLHGSAGAAALAVAAGCATLDTPLPKLLSIEPVFNVKNATQSSDAYFSLAEYHAGLQAWDKAIAAYRKALLVDARHVPAHNGLGVALAHNGQLALAEAALRQAVALSPQQTHLQNNLGYILLLAGKPQEAAMIFKVATQQDPANTVAQANLQQALQKLEQAEIVASSTTSTAAPTTTTAAPNSAAATVAEAPGALTASSAAPASQDQQPASNRAVAPAFQVGFAPTVPALQVRRAGADEVAAPPLAGLTAMASATVSLGPWSSDLMMPGFVAPTLGSVTPPTSRSPLEISNGNGVTGMANRVAQWLSTQGVQTHRLSNQRPYAQAFTVVQYREGHVASAWRVARSLPAQAGAQVAPTLGLRTDVRVVLGHDWVSAAACLNTQSCRLPSQRLATAPTQQGE